MITDVRQWKPGDKVYELVDVIEEEREALDLEPGIVAVDRGESFRHIPMPGERIFDLLDVIEEDIPASLPDLISREEMMQKVSEIAERISREIIPAIAERVIREEIEKLKAIDA
ncbi:MAG: hypothetical protein JW950_10880 [Deltaproteobacteria bacterium]|nr:hypothetical protein [Deltaproteobacteria bacterium]